MTDGTKSIFLHNIFQYSVIFITIFSVDVLLNLLLMPAIRRDLFLLGYLLYLFMILPVSLVLLYVINLVSQFSPSDDSVFFSFWSFLLVLGQLFSLFYENLSARFTGMLLLASVIFAISYGIWWTYYIKNSTESIRKILFLWTQVLIIAVIQLGTYLNKKYVNDLFTKNGIILNSTIAALFIVLLILGKRIAFIITGNAERQNLKFDDNGENYQETNKSKSSVKKSKNGNKPFIIKSYIFNAVLLIFNIIVLLSLLYAPEEKIEIYKSHLASDNKQKMNSGAVQPNIILVVFDTVRAKSLDLFGYDKPTMPRLKKWSEKVTLYKNAYANSSFSLASIASIFTGLYPSKHKAYYHYSKTFDELDRPITSTDLYQPLSANYSTLAEILIKNGYTTACISANFEEMNPEFGLAQGFLTYDIRETNLPQLLPYRLLKPAARFFTPLAKIYKDFRPAELITDEALKWLKENKKRNFFLFLNYKEGSLPCLPLPKYKRLFYDERKVRRSRYPEQVKQVIYYDADLRYLDDELDRLLEGIKSCGLYTDSLIIVTSAHGISLGEWGHWGDSITVNEWEIKVPLIIKYPSQTEGQTADYPVQLADIFPTVLDAVGITTPAWIDGINLKKDQERLVAVVQKPDLRVVQKYGSQYLRTLLALISGEEKVIISSNGPSQVFNLSKDPEEKFNIASSKLDLVKQLKKAFDIRNKLAPQQGAIR